MFVSHLQSGSESLQVHLHDSFALLSEYRADTILYLLHLNAEERSSSTMLAARGDATSAEILSTSSDT